MLFPFACENRTSGPKRHKQTTLMPEIKSPAYPEDESSVERRNGSAAGGKDVAGEKP
jgi:hypothetical protein